MDSTGKKAGHVTPVKELHGSRSRNQEISKFFENMNPNLSHSSPKSKPSKSSLTTNSAKSQKSAAKNPNPVVCSPRNKIRQRKFVVAKKNYRKEKGIPAVDCKCKEKGNVKKCLCQAYETLRSSQEEFFKNPGNDSKNSEIEEEIENIPTIRNLSTEIESLDQPEISTIKRGLEEVRRSVPEPRSGNVMTLVKAFEKLLTIPNLKDSDSKEEEEEEGEEEEDNEKKSMKLALQGLETSRVSETQASSFLFCPSELILTTENLGLDPRFQVSSSWDSSRGSFSISSRTSNGGRRGRRNSSESSGTMAVRRWKKQQQLKVTCQKPFKLRTEQRGRLKEEEFMKKMQEMMMEEEKQRIPIAQGLPWTTDEPECLIKPPVKDNTRPLDLKLHSDVRAVERAEFDYQIEEKLSLIEQYKMERERQQKLAEEEEIRRLRKELVPKAQPMPYFDRPFIPRRSMKHPTVPREPKFHIPQQQHKKIKCCLSWNDMSPYISQQ